MEYWRRHMHYSMDPILRYSKSVSKVLECFSICVMCWYLR
jgi:hypothetical protein